MEHNYLGARVNEYMRFVVCTLDVIMKVIRSHPLETMTASHVVQICQFKTQANVFSKQSCAGSESSPSSACVIDLHQPGLGTAVLSLCKRRESRTDQWPEMGLGDNHLEMTTEMMLLLCNLRAEADVIFCSSCPQMILHI